MGKNGKLRNWGEWEKYGIQEKIQKTGKTEKTGKTGKLGKNSKTGKLGKQKIGKLEIIWKIRKFRKIGISGKL